MESLEARGWVARNLVSGVEKSVHSEDVNVGWFEVALESLTALDCL